MKQIKLFLSLLTIILLCLFLIIHCKNEPTAPVRDNPYDTKGIAGDNIPPIASFTVTPNSGIVNETIFTFDASASKENDKPDWLLDYRWDWNNDGYYDTDWSKNKIITYTFTVGGGNKIIKLQVKGLKELTSSTTNTVYVNTYPVASFTVTPISGYTTDAFNFDASACSDYEDNVSNLQVRWDWEGDRNYDTNYSTTKTTTHQYSTAGTKNATLQVKDSAGLTNTASK